MKELETTPSEETLASSEIARIENSILILKEENEIFEPYIRNKDNEDFKEFIKSYTEKERDRLANALTSDVNYSKDTLSLMSDMLGGIKFFNRFLSISAMNYAENLDNIKNLNSRKKGIVDGTIVLSDGE